MYDDTLPTIHESQCGPDKLARTIAQLNEQLAKAAARHVAENITQNPWFHGRPDRIQEIVERVILVAHYRMSGNT